MKRTVLILTLAMAVIMTLILTGCGNVEQPQKVKVTKPASGDWLLGKYPIIKKSQLTHQKIMEMGFSPVLLEKETWLLSSNGKGPRDFTYKPFPTGTIVLVNKSGEIVYVYDCANRSYVPLVTEWITPTAGQKPAPGVPPISPQGGSGGGGFWHNLWNSLTKGLGSGLGTIGKLFLWVLAALLLAALLAWILSKLLPWLFAPKQKKEEKKEETETGKKGPEPVTDGGKKGPEIPPAITPAKETGDDKGSKFSTEKKEHEAGATISAVGTPELDFIPSIDETGVAIFRRSDGMRIVSHGKNEVKFRPNGEFEGIIH